MFVHLRHRRILWSIAAIVVACATTAAVLAGRPWEHLRKDPQALGKTVAAGHDDGVPVKVIRPRRDSSFDIAVNQLVTVEPYYQANLKARAAGLVVAVHKDIGDSVRRGELLVAIDEPDLMQEVAQKQAVIAQRLQDVIVAQSAVRNAQALLDVARAAIDQRRAEVQEKTTTRDTRLKRLNRFRAMSGRNVVDAGVIDEEEGQYQAAAAAATGAEVAVNRAEADLREKQASLDGARAEIGLKESLVEVARRDRDRAQALLDYAHVTAPFNGTITQRNVDPGAFVQNATTGASEALISVARTDIVTAAFQLPDYAAAYVSRDTAVEIQLDELPGTLIRGRVTRFSPSIRGTDRTMRVEVDLFNGTEAEYRQFAAKAIACGLAAGADAGLSALAPTATGYSLWAENQKGSTDRFPLCAGAVTEGGPPHRLIPGMGGTARVVLQEFDDVYLIPTSAIFTVGGKSYLLVVLEGKSRLVPIRVQVNDGRLAKVAVVARPSGGKSGDREVLRELTGTEEIIASRQVEIGDGQPVRATHEDW